MDFLSGLPLTPTKKNSVWVVVDRLTKTGHFILVKTDFSLQKLVKLYISDIVRLHGVPVSIISDRDPRFMSQFWGKLHEALGLRLDLSTTFHPQTDGDELSTLQTHDFVRTSSDQDDFKSFVNISDHVAQPFLQETLQKNIMEPCSRLCDRSRMTYEERMLQNDELDEWWTHVKEKSRKHDEKPKRHHDEHMIRRNQFKVGDKREKGALASQTHVKEKQIKHDEEPKRRHDEHVMKTKQFKVGDKVLLEKMDP
ncbi:uncharacterized protein LOC128280461 [Gossypium arboreum]|uniref:uncharacterized protein LOC128280461 n=1 Tax=Gossypium arboreum TaxID=29729 RepID=UPI0022F19BE3|nr:uncharacterized protein LOC128280461 [Gossypium arboreum]